MAANMFINIADLAEDNLKGEATEENHKDWIVVKSVAWSVERAVDLTDLGSSQRGYANVNFAKLAITAELSRASAGLMWLAATGLSRKIIVSQCRVTEDDSSAMQEYLKWTLENGQVTKYEVSCSEDGIPEETWELAYRTLKLEHKLVSATDFKLTGVTKEFGWNLETGKIL